MDGFSTINTDETDEAISPSAQVAGGWADLWLFLQIFPESLERWGHPIWDT